MPNHFHLLVETPEANLSRTGQWLNVSYSVWFNRRHQRSGHLFHGRFAAMIIEDDAGFQEVGRYVHLNPVRVMELGLGKRQRAAGRIGLSTAPSREVVAQRLKVLREWKWSSYPAYASYSPSPDWLTQTPLGSLCGGRKLGERQGALRAYTEKAVQEGLSERPWERLIGGVVLGSEAFAKGLFRKLKGNAREQRGLQSLRQCAGWDQIVQAVAGVKGEPWEKFRDRHGDWGRDAVLWLGRRTGRLPLRKLSELAGGMDYTAAGAAVSRFHRRLSKDPKLSQLVNKIHLELSNIEM
ncbi:MAG: hypothetical protein QOF48_2172 [Verrucomicrobiota bacterium]